MTTSFSINTTKDHYAVARKRMIQEQIVERGISDARVLGIMSQVPRHEFVDDALKTQAYSDAPLSIGEGQTISQPYIVALMTQALQLTGTEKILEIGTGCGYQTFILALAAQKVYTIERVKSLAIEARRRFKKFEVRNIVMRVGDGSLGWAEAEPFDRVLTSCASPKIPQRLVNQLVMGGQLVIPVTSRPGCQNLLRVTRTQDGSRVEDLGACQFVRMVGRYGYREEEGG